MAEELGTVGRYEVVGRLAMGGMAEILLGRLHGPAGFERPVVIKRILPHLSAEKAFTQMFLDEARIAAAIGHPNVVQVHELGQEGDDLFIIMEYLEGESVASLLRRLRIRARKIPPALAAHIAADACSGLQAAHQLQDGDGRSQQLVHRDICPNNLFVTYDGTAKVLDFGIAKAAHRITHTEAGMLKGKFAYMSPEQCRGEAVDHRSDLFSLGVVLYEMLTGRRLFGRDSKLKTLQAVASDAIPAPSVVEPECPPALDAVCVRALSRDRDERYSDAQAMRRDLAKALRSMDAPDLPELALADLMRDLFSDRLKEKQEMLRGVRDGANAPSIPPAEVDVEVELPSIDPTQYAGPPIGSAVGAGALELKPTGRPLARAAFGATAVVLILIAGLFVGFGTEVQSSESPSEGPPTELAAAPPEPSKLPAAERPPSAGIVDPSTVEVEIDSDPTGASVEIDGNHRGTTPLTLRMEKSSESHELRLSRDGSTDEVETVTMDRDQRIFLNLATETPVPAPARRARRRPRRPPAETSGAVSAMEPERGFHRLPL